MHKTQRTVAASQMVSTLRAIQHCIPDLIGVYERRRKFKNHYISIRSSLESFRTSVKIFLSHCHHHITVSSKQKREIMKKFSTDFYRTTQNLMRKTESNVTTKKDTEKKWKQRSNDARATNKKASKRLC